MTDITDARIEAVAKALQSLHHGAREWKSYKTDARAALEADARFLAEREREYNAKFAGTFNSGEIT